jgi:hypothetical protein
MANKKNKEVKVRDLKPSQDAKGGAARSNAGASARAAHLGGSTLSSRGENNPNRNKLY